MTAATYATGGNRCGKCGHEWADEPPRGGEFRREVMGTWIADGCARCQPTPERKPVAGWVAHRHDRNGAETAWRLPVVGGHADSVHAIVTMREHGFEWSTGGRLGRSGSLLDACIAAEDALIAVRDEISRAVGM